MVEQNNTYDNNVHIIIDENNDIYKKIKNDYIEYSISSDFTNDKIDIGIWIMEYSNKMTPDMKKQIYSRYGNQKLLSQLGEITELRCWKYYSEFVGKSECDVSENATIAFIIKNDILYEFVPYDI